MTGNHNSHADHSMTEHLDAVRTETHQLATTVYDLVADAEAAAREQLSRRPYATLAMAMGVGYVLGGGVPTRLTTLLVSFGARMALQAAAHEVITRLGGSTPATA